MKLQLSFILLVFLKDTTFIQQRCIKLIKSDSKDICNVIINVKINNNKYFLSSKSAY